MDRILALDEQPPYLEVYKHAPIMYMAVCEYEAASLGVPPKDWLLWVHGVQSIIDAIAATHGLYKVKAYAQGRSCLFSISPDTPPKEQAAIMLGAAQQLLQALNKVGHLVVLHGCVLFISTLLKQSGLCIVAFVCW